MNRRILTEIAEFDEFFENNTRDGISCVWLLNPHDIAPAFLADKYYTFPLSSYSCYAIGIHPKYLVILKSAIRTNRTKITIRIPYLWAGLVIGTKGTHIRQIAREIGVQRIIVETFEN